MIETFGRDPITLWQNLCAGWLSGRETWADEVFNNRYYSYSNILSCHWDYHIIENEGHRIRRSLLISKKSSSKAALKQFSMSKISHDNFFSMVINPKHTKLISCAQMLKKKNGGPQLHLYIPEIEFPRQFILLTHMLNTSFREWNSPPMLPVAFHITVIYFSQRTMPLLLPIFGRSAFLDPDLVNCIEEDTSKLKHILSPSYKLKNKQKIWKHVVDAGGV